jgi:hypothetical protein
MAYEGVSGTRKCLHGVQIRKTTPTVALCGRLHDEPNDVGGCPVPEIELVGKQEEELDAHTFTVHELDVFWLRRSNSQILCEYFTTLRILRGDGVSVRHSAPIDGMSPGRFRFKVEEFENRCFPFVSDEYKRGEIDADFLLGRYLQ